jgi:CubicO group peptidase (beta-lactamase class C family)
VNEIAPTEQDEEFRKDMVRGTVHDPGAAMGGGIGCHAGVFSNAYDLAEMGQTWLAGGTFKGVQLVREDILNIWTQRGFPEGDNRRGVAFDKPALEPETGPHL